MPNYIIAFATFHVFWLSQEAKKTYISVAKVSRMDVERNYYRQKKNEGKPL